jgi:outer membrane protein assembly factor BamB
MTRFHLILLLLLSCTAFADAADWPQFRGVNSGGIADDSPIPTDFSPGKNELWNLRLDPGHSSPCIVGDLIFLTTFLAEKNELAVICVDRKSGQLRWRHAVKVKAVEKGHPSFNPASSTPASDGERVVAYFGSYGLICLDLAGNRLWEIKLPLTKSYAGNATSPIIVADRVILYRGNYVDHYLLALDKQTGQQLWKVPQPERFSSNMACTACPIVAGDTLIVHSVSSVKAFEITSGKRRWYLGCFTTATSTPVLAGDEVIVASWNQTGETSLTPAFPSFTKLVAENDKNKDRLISASELPRLMYFHRSEGTEAPQNGAPLRFSQADANKNGTITEPEWDQLLARVNDTRADHIEHGMLGIPLNSRGTLKAEQVRRLEQNSIPEVPSPLYHDGYIYFVKNGGVLSCLELETGKRVYRIRTRGTGTHYASPIIAGGMLISTAGNGRISLLRLGPEPQVIASNDMGDEVYATPAAVDGVLYVRTHSRLYAFGTDH